MRKYIVALAMGNVMVQMVQLALINLSLNRSYESKK
jgi:hypothetical protein